MGADFLIVTGLGFIAALVLLVFALRAGRQMPEHRVLWIIALTALGISIIFRFVIFIGATTQGAIADVLPVLVGNIAVILVFISAFWQPRWTGWVLIGSALAMPLLSLLFELLAGNGSLDQSVIPGLTGSYSIPAVITGTLLVLSVRVRNSRDRERLTA